MPIFLCQSRYEWRNYQNVIRIPLEFEYKYKMFSLYAFKRTLYASKENLLYMRPFIPNGNT